MPTKNKIETLDFIMCCDCADIVTQGYSDSITDTEQHQALCNSIDNDTLPVGYYWLENRKTDINEHYKLCEGCGVRGAQHTVTACKS